MYPPHQTLDNTDMLSLDSYGW